MQRIVLLNCKDSCCDIKNLEETLYTSFFFMELNIVQRCLPQWYCLLFREYWNNRTVFFIKLFKNISIFLSIYKWYLICSGILYYQASLFCVFCKKVKDIHATESIYVARLDSKIYKEWETMGTIKLQNHVEPSSGIWGLRKMLVCSLP